MCAVPVRDKSLPVQSRLRHSLYRNFVAQRALRLAQKGWEEGAIKDVGVYFEVCGLTFIN
jgi:hypothetical protein